MSAPRKPTATVYAANQRTVYAANQRGMVHLRQHGFAVCNGPVFSDDRETVHPERVTCPKCHAALDAIKPVGRVEGGAANACCEAMRAARRTDGQHAKTFLAIASRAGRCPGCGAALDAAEREGR